MPPLPSCECIRKRPLSEIAVAIYCAFFSGITNPMNLPPCECMTGKPLADILAAIYCAQLQFISQPFSGTIEPAQINGITAFGEGVLLSNPDPNQPLYFDGNIVSSFPWQQVADNTEALIEITLGQISDATQFGREVLGLSASPFTLVGCNDLGNAVLADGAQAALFMTGGGSTGANANVGTPTAVQTINGITVVLT
jgi:hypothetical protein